MDKERLDQQSCHSLRGGIYVIVLENTSDELKVMNVIKFFSRCKEWKKESTKMIGGGHGTSDAKLSGKCYGWNVKGINISMSSVSKSRLTDSLICIWQRVLQQNKGSM